MLCTCERVPSTHSECKNFVSSMLSPVLVTPETAQSWNGNISQASLATRT